MAENITKFKPLEVGPLLYHHSEIEVLRKIISEKHNEVKQYYDQETRLERKQNDLNLAKEELKEYTPDTLETKFPQETYKTRKIQKQVLKQIKKNEKFTYCFYCNSFCHDPCSLEEFIQKGSPDIRECAAFDRKDDCEKCQHNYEIHGHEYEVEKPEEIWEDEEYPEIIYITKENTSAVAEKMQKEAILSDLEDKIKKDQGEIQEIEEKIDEELAIVAFLHQQIKNNGLAGPLNEYTVDYLKKEIQLVDKDKSLTSAECEQKKKMLEKSLELYEDYSEQIKEAEDKNQNPNINEAQLNEIEKMIKEESEETLKEYESFQKFEEKPQDKKNFSEGSEQKKEKYKFKFE